MAKLLLVTVVMMSSTRGAWAAVCATGITESTIGAASVTVTVATTDAACAYLVAGYYVTGGALPPVACPVGKYCPGGNAANSGGAAGTYVAAGAFVSNGGATACPTGYTNAGGLTMVDESFCNGVAAGYYIGTTLAANTANNLVTAVATCPANSYCPALLLAIPQASIDAVASTWNGVTGTFVMKGNVVVVTITANTAPNALTCPSVSTLTGTSPSGSSAVTACLTPAGAYVDGFTAVVGSTPASATINYCQAHYYCPGAVAMTALNAGRTACPINSGGVLGTTGSLNAAVGTALTAAAKSTVSSCQLVAGFYVSSYTAASGSTPASATVDVCPANSYYPGYASTASSIFLTYVVSGAGVGAVACPFVTAQGDASSNSALVANNAITFCVLDSGYYQTAGTAVTTTALATATVAVCPSNYYCP